LAVFTRVKVAGGYRLQSFIILCQCKSSFWGSVQWCSHRRVNANEWKPRGSSAVHIEFSQRNTLADNISTQAHEKYVPVMTLSLQTKTNVKCPVSGVHSVRPTVVILQPQLYLH